MLFIFLNVRGHTHTHIHIKDVLMADMMRVRFTLISHIAHQLCKKKNINITLTLVSIFFSWAFSPQFVKAHVKNNSFEDDKRKIFLPTNSHHDCIYQDLCNKMAFNVCTGQKNHLLNLNIRSTPISCFIHFLYNTNIKDLSISKVLIVKF